MKQEFASQGWLVRVQTIGAVPPTAFDFAVARTVAQDAIAAVLSHPQVGYEDQVTSTAPLTAMEIKSFKLKTDEVRTYGRRYYDAAAGRWKLLSGSHS